MILEYFKDVVAGVEQKLAAGPASETIARKTLTLELARLGVRLFGGAHRVAWCGIATPYDLLAALDVTPCFVEFVGATLASTGLAGTMLEAAEQADFSTDSCAYHRSVIGADLAGLMPEPDFYVGTSGPCTGGLAVIESLARRHGKPLFVIHVPPDDGADAVSFLTEQYRELGAWVEQRLGQKLEPERLRAALRLSNQTRELLLEIYRLAAAVPCPARPRDMVNFGITLPLLFGTEAAVRVARAYRDELAGKLAARPGDLPREPVRLMWLQNRIQFKNPIDELLATELGAHIVVDELNDVWWEAVDPDDPYRSLARRTLSSPLMLSAERRIEHLRDLGRRYDVDGVINPCHWGCRQGTGARGLVQQGLRAQGLPVLNLEVDCIDARSFSFGQIRTRLEAFVELLRQRGGGAAAGS